MITSSKNDPVPAPSPASGQLPGVPDAAGRVTLVVDIGSNSVRSMAAYYLDGSLRFGPKTACTTRIAEGFLPDKTLKQPAMERTLRHLQIIRDRADSLGIPCCAYATSAVRDAVNRADFLAEAEDKIGIPVRVLTGEEEAAFARLGAGIGPEDGMIDIGGGSFQISAGDFKMSFPLGCVKIRDLCGEEETLTLLNEKLPEAVDALLGDTVLPHAESWTAVGGTSTTLACMLQHADGIYEPRLVRNARCTPKDLDTLLRIIAAIPLEKRWLLPLLRKRADVILGGGMLLSILMEKLDITCLRFSDVDGLEGYAMHLMNEAGSPVTGE